MAILKCPECGADASSQAQACPGCGFNVEQYIRTRQKIAASDRKEASMRNKAASAANAKVVSRRLKDPDSAEWSLEETQGSYPDLQAIGAVKSKNSFGGYGAPLAFVCTHTGGNNWRLEALEEIK